jgi:hypothetical protein
VPVPSGEAATDDDESGRGLAIVDALASRWGVDRFEGGKSVWFEVPRLDQAGDIVIE